LRHAAVNEHQRILELGPRRDWGIRVIQNAMLRHQAPTANAEFGVAFPRWHAFDKFHARPNATRVLPTTA
jgi:hypothetical protein